MRGLLGNVSVVGGLLASTMLVLSPTPTASAGRVTLQQAPVEVEDPARQIVEEMRRVYSQCETYQDEGEVETVFVMESGKRTDMKPFQTVFKRGGPFRFEFRSRAGEYEWHQYVVWNDSEGIHSWWAIKPETMSHPSIAKALAGPTGVSGGSATMIPTLLMKDINWGAWLRRDIGVTLLGYEYVEDTSCAKIVLECEYGPDWTVWVDERRLVRQLFMTKEVSNFTTETTITYRPQMNTPIPPSEFGFEPPVR